MSKRQRRSVKQTLLYDNRVLGVMLICAVLPLYSAALDRRELRATYEQDAPQDVPQTAIAQRPDVSRSDKASIEEAKAMQAGIRDATLVTISGRCSQAVRESVEKSQRGKRFAHLFGGSATITANNFLREGYGILWPRDKALFGGELHLGDILFKRRVMRKSNGVFLGHVGTFVGNNLVGENSSTYLGRVNGALGYRTLAQFGFYDGSVDIVGRLPLPARLYLVINGRAAKLIPSGELYDAPSPRGAVNQFSVQRREVSRALGRVSYDTRRVPLREALKAVGYNVARVEYSKYKVAVTIEK